MSEIKARRALQGLAPCKSNTHECKYNRDCTHPQTCKYWRVMMKVRKEQANGIKERKTRSIYTRDS